MEEKNPKRSVKKAIRGNPKKLSVQLSKKKSEGKKNTEEKLRKLKKKKDRQKIKGSSIDTIEEVTEILSKKDKVKVEKSSATDSIKEVTVEKRVISPEKPSKKKKTQKFEDKNLDKTVFVGNLPADITRKGLEKLFEKIGPVQSVRLRGAIPVKNKIPKKVAEIKHKFHDSLHSRIGYVVFKTHEATKTALSLNGTYVQGHHIKVDTVSKVGEKKTFDQNRSVFVGNLPFDVDDEQVWSAFSGCGEVESVRVIRDPETGAGKGFGYVLFADKSGKQAALSETKLEVEGRKVRIKPVEGSQKTPRSNNAKNFARRKALKTKKSGDPSQSRKSSKKLIKKHQAEKQKKNLAQAFKKLL